MTGKFKLPRVTDTRTDADGKKSHVNRLDGSKQDKAFSFMKAFVQFDFGTNYFRNHSVWLFPSSNDGPSK